MGVLELALASLGNLHQLVHSPKQVRPSQQRIIHTYCRTGAWVHGHRDVVFLGQFVHFPEFLQLRVLPRLVHQAK